MLRKLVVLAIAVLSYGSIHSQLSDESNNLKVYVNCIWCYQDYLRTQITWVDFVQDQFVSEVDLTITSLVTGSGGTEFLVQFSGKRELSGMSDTLKLTTNAINTENEIRESLARKVKLGLVRYAACGKSGDCLSVSSNAIQDSMDVGIGSNPMEDPWNAWVFRVGANGNVAAQNLFN